MMMLTNTQYMSDPARAERVVRRFMDMTVQELRNKRTKKYVDYMTEAIVQREYLEEERLRDMTYMELACLIDSVGGDSGYDGYEYDSFARQLCYYKMAASALLEGGKVSIPARLFLALPLRAFYSALGNISGAKDIQSEFEGIRSGCSYTEDCTIKDFLWEKIGELNRVWVPTMSSAWYENDIITAHEDIGQLLVNSFRTAFPERFRAEDVCRRYRNPSVVKKDGRIFYMALDEAWVKERRTEQRAERQVERRTE